MNKFKSAIVFFGVVAISCLGTYMIVKSEMKKESMKGQTECHL